MRILIAFASCLLLAGCMTSDPSPAARTAPPTMPSPAEALRDFSPKETPAQFISGGWGYTRDDALVIVTPTGMGNDYFNLAPVEYVFVELRNVQEFSKQPPEGQRFAIVKFDMEVQQLVQESGKVYDMLKGKVFVVPEKDVPAVKALMAGVPEGADVCTPAVMEKVQAVPREFWFDITEPFTRNAKLMLAETGGSK